MHPAKCPVRLLTTDKHLLVHYKPYHLHQHSCYNPGNHRSRDKDYCNSPSRQMWTGG
jgi:hypothetical protein